MIALFAFHKKNASLAALALLLVSFVGHTIYTRDGTVIWRGRSFYGAYVVTQDDTRGYRLMFHGTTLHGVELLKAPPQPLTYYAHGGPLGDVMRVLGPNAHAIGAVGLGIGSVACYARPDQSWTFFEIDGLVADVAARSGLFRELPQCAPQAKVILGDGRLSLERGPAQQYDLLILDAFSSDAIPVHLVTREAFASYLRALKPHGAIALHITNRYFDLAPIIARIAPEVGLVAYDWDFKPPPKTDYALLSVSHWIVLARSSADLGAIATDGHWTRRTPNPKVRLWTDDYSNLLAALR
jgi:SAM-dependent methyltransferase